MFKENRQPDSENSSWEPKWVVQTGGHWIKAAFHLLFQVLYTLHSMWFSSSYNILQILTFLSLPPIPTCELNYSNPTCKTFHPTYGLKYSTPTCESTSPPKMCIQLSYPNMYTQSAHSNMCLQLPYSNMLTQLPYPNMWTQIAHLILDPSLLQPSYNNYLTSHHYLSMASLCSLIKI